MPPPPRPPCMLYRDGADEAYQLTQSLQRGQADFSGEAIDEMMKVRATHWRARGCRSS